MRCTRSASALCVAVRHVESGRLIRARPSASQAKDKQPHAGAAGGETARPSVRGANSRRRADGSRSDGLAVFGQAAAGEASTPPEWAAVLAGGNVLQMGSQALRVAHLQQLLVDSGHDVVVDEEFGSGTRRAVAAFQRSRGMTVDGRVGVRTATALSGGTTSGPLARIASRTARRTRR